MATARFWPTWDLVKHDAFHRPICGLELKLLGALFILANGSTFFTVTELTYMSEEVVRSFFLTWLGHMFLSIKAEYIYFPSDDVTNKFVVEEYAKLGFPDFVGSVDCVHVGWDKCPFSMWKHLFKGKENQPCIRFLSSCMYISKVCAVSLTWPPRFQE